MYSSQIQAIEEYFNSVGLKTIEIQGDDPNVGIFSGWVIFELPDGRLWEVNYQDALYNLYNEDAQEEIIRIGEEYKDE